jgi:hypothetical protein
VLDAQLAARVPENAVTAVGEEESGVAGLPRIQELAREVRLDGVVQGRAAPPTEGRRRTAGGEDLRPKERVITGESETGV